jgi:hypothetical protein
MAFLMPLPNVRSCLVRLLGLIAMALVAGSFPGGSALAQGAGAAEYEIKGAFLFNFARFAEWPNSAFSSTTQPLIIGIIGEDPFDSQILDGLAHKTVDGRPLVIRHFKDARDIDVCHLLFVGSVKAKELTAILDSVKGKSILTVGESSGFLTSGGMIRFCFEDQKIRFEVSLSRIKSASVKLSAKLLSVAIIVHQ